MRIADPIGTDSPGDAAGGSSRFWRPKGNLTRLQLSLVLLAIVIPFLVVAIRVLALPGLVPPGTPLEALRILGGHLTDVFSFGNAHEEMRNRIFSLLFIPTCVLLAVVVRLTLGIRVLGFRAILIALSFYVTGIVPGLALILLAVALITVLRPHLKHIGLPYFARVSTILGVVAGIMVVALIVGPWLQREMMWSMAFFPVIVLALLAEGIARTAEREGVQSAQWRTFTTVTLALVMASLGYVVPLREFLLEFPELFVVQIAAILLVSEFLDLRLLQDWEAKRSGLGLPHLFSSNHALKVAVVRNRTNTHVIGRLGRECPEKYGRRSVQRIIDALRAAGHEVRVFEGDISLLPGLREYLPPNPKTGEPGGLVFNLAYGIQGDARYTHVPAMLEMAGVPYTGASPLGHALALDKVVAKVLMESAGIPTPAFCVMSNPKDDTGGLRYPLIVKPRHESSSYGVSIVRTRRELEDAVASVIGTYKQGALVEEFIEGREINVPLIGNNPVECLPLVEIDFRGRPHTALTHEDKFNTTGEEPGKICPAMLDEDTARRCRDISIACFLACHCRDYARVDLRVSTAGEPYILEINSMATLGWNGSLVTAAKAAGYTFTDVVGRIVEVARERYRTGGASQVMGLPPTVVADPRLADSPIHDELASSISHVAGAS